jgi:hypothetical protein
MFWNPLPNERQDKCLSSLRADSELCERPCSGRLRHRLATSARRPVVMVSEGAKAAIIGSEAP